MTKEGKKIIYVIYLTTECNYHCTYCYENFERKQAFNKESLYKVLDFIFSNDSGKRISIEFMGGEPLLKFDLINAAVLYIEKMYADRNVNYHMTTNGTFLTDEIISFLKEKNFSLRLSFDGIREAHCINRKSKDGKTDYCLIFCNINKIRDAGMQYSIRMTITQSTIPFLFDSVVFLHENRLNNICMIFDVNASLDELSYKNFQLQAEKITNYYLEELDKGNKFSVDQIDGKFINMLADFGNCFGMCDAGINNFKIMPNGDIYPCGFVIGNPDFIIGNVNTSVDVNLAKKIAISLYDSEDKKCRSCKIKYFCHGMKCGYMNYLTTGKINVPSETTCVLEKTFFPEVVRVLEHIRGQGNDSIEKVFGKYIRYLVSQGLKLSETGKEIYKIISD